MIPCETCHGSGYVAVYAVPLTERTPEAPPLRKQVVKLVCDECRGSGVDHKFPDYEP